jgi:quinol monooxygenase YgiN
MKKLENKMLITYSVTRQDEGTIKHVYTTDHLEDLVMQMIEMYSNEVKNKDSKDTVKQMKEDMLECFDRLTYLS